MHRRMAQAGNRASPADHSLQRWDWISECIRSPLGSTSCITAPFSLARLSESCPGLPGGWGGSTDPALFAAGWPHPSAGRREASPSLFLCCLFFSLPVSFSVFGLSFPCSFSAFSSSLVFASQVASPLLLLLPVLLPVCFACVRASSFRGREVWGSAPAAALRNAHQSK